MIKAEKIKIRKIYLSLSDLEREDREQIFEKIGAVKGLCESLLFPGEFLELDEVEKRMREI